MSSIVVVGAQWGDEGKGKLVDYLALKADWVVRYQGGSNAGHTLVVNGTKTKLSLVPSGILRPNVKCLIAAGVVVNPDVLISEIETLKTAGVDVSPERLMIDRDAHLVLEYHAAIDKAREDQLGKEKIGTTGRGIGPAYEDRAGRTGIRLAELFLLPELKEKVTKILETKNLYLTKVLGASSGVAFETVWGSIERAAQILKPFVANGSLVLDRALGNNNQVIFEGAQATLLDQTFGTVPFVTSSHTIAGAALVGCGIGPRRLNYVLGVAKAYCTRVGSGPFPTELTDDLGDRIRTAGAEFGTVTGRPRRCGWFDAVTMRRAVRLNGIDSLAITKLDVLSGVEKLKVAVEYTLDGRTLEDPPALASELNRVQVKYIELPGFSLQSPRDIASLPEAAQSYLSTISELVGCPISIVSVGAERESTLLTKHSGPFKQFVGA